MGKENKVNNWILAWEKGEEAERRVFQALEELKEAGIIKNCGRSFQYSQEDLGGRDLAIVTIDGKVIWLQVKSSFSQSDKEKYLRRGIHYVVVQQKSDPEIREEILRILKAARKRKRRPKHEGKIKVQI